MCLSYLILHQTDAAGLVTFDTKIRDYIPARSASAHLLAIARALESCEPREESSIAGVLHDVAERLGHRQMVILISDLFDNAEKLIEAFHHLRHERHEVIVMQIMAEDELTFPFRKFSQFESLEAGASKVKLDPATARATYLQNVARHLKAIRDGCNQLRISHVLFKTSETVEHALSEYLALRMGSR
jgi:uncharacterized protein (DUF58 family)